MFPRERETVRCAIPFLSVLETSLGRFRLEGGAASRATRKSRERRGQSRTATYLSIACRSQEKGSVLHTRRWSFEKKKKKSLSTNRISKLDRNVIETLDSSSSGEPRRRACAAISVPPLGVAFSSRSSKLGNRFAATILFDTVLFPIIDQRNLAGR